MKKKNPMEQLNFSSNDIPYLLRHCAEQLLLQVSVDCCNRLLQDLACDAEFSAFCKEHPELADLKYTYHPDEDTLGLLYQSLCDMKSRKNSGSYYTPASIVNRLISIHLPEISKTQTVFDPSCGSGAFLLQLPDYIPLTNLYGNDLDPLCITLARLNLAMKYRITGEEELDILYRNFTVSDYLSSVTVPDTGRPQAGYDIILGNPPWGTVLTETQKTEYRKHFSCACRHGTEIFDLFIEQSLRVLSPDGVLSFVLPEALLSVKMHQPVRELLLSSTRALSVEYLGDVFALVYCPSIILTLKKSHTGEFYKNATVITKDRSHTICAKRDQNARHFSFALSDEEYGLLKKIQRCPNCTTLHGQADFALGIVTGNNRALLSDTALPGTEPVIKGKDISKYHVDSFSGYLYFQPERFQQTAPSHFYRAKEKLFYRFINRRLIFAYDTTGLLSLNSCNIVIPHIEGLSVKYVMAVLNSSVAQFVFEKQFASVKVLRSHLEAIPIPVVDKETQDHIVSLVDRLITTDKESQEYQTTFLTLDQMIAKLFGMDENEYASLCL